jgi:hypothetical protein
MTTEQKLENFKEGYAIGMSHSRPLVELETRVDGLQGRVKLLSWTGAIVGTLALVTFVCRMPLFKKFLGRKADEKEFLQWQEDRRKAKEKEEQKEATVNVNGLKVRRHARDFETRAVW